MVFLTVALSLGTRVVPAHEHCGASTRSELEEPQSVPGLKPGPHAHQARTLPLTHHGSFHEPCHLISWCHINVCKLGAKGTEGPKKTSDRELVPGHGFVPSTGAFPFTKSRAMRRQEP